MQNFKHNIHKKNLYIKSAHFKSAMAGIVSDDKDILIAIDYQKVPKDKVKDVILKLLEKYENIYSKDE